MPEHSKQSADKPPTPIVAMIALASPRMPRVDALVQDVSKFDPGAVLSEPSEQTGKLLSLTYNGNLGAVSYMPAPIPPRDLEGPCATAWWWPEATEAMERHTCHLLVALLGSEGDPLSRLLDATRLVAAAANRSDSIGVYWGAGALVHQAEEFARQTREASRDNAPVHLWIDMRVEKNDDGTYRFFTTGMSQLDKLELEIASTVREPQDILAFAYDLIHYIVAQDITIADGETVGRTADHKVRVTRGHSIDDPKRMVLRLDF